MRVPAPQKETWDNGVLSSELAAAMEGAEIVAHNAKFDLLWLAVKFGIRPKRIFCTLTASRLLTAGSDERNGLDDVLWRHLGVKPGQDYSRSDWGGLFLTEGQVEYAQRDVTHLHELRRVLENEIAAAHLQAVCRLEMELIPIVVDMEYAGIAVEPIRLRKLCDGAASKEREIFGRLSPLLKSPSLNLNSPNQLKSALARVGILVDDTNEGTLAQVDDGTIIPLILAYREQAHICQQAESFLEASHSDGRIHSRFEPMGTDTGRFSSKAPNLQSVTRGPMRSCFVAPPGYSLVIADYSQIELRAVASIAGETNMLEAFARGDDLHRLTASAILDKPVSDVSKEDRQVAKSANFGLIYGQTAPGFAAYARNNYGVSVTVSQAERIRKRFFDSYPGLAKWHGQCRQMANGNVLEVRTILGRRRLLPSSAQFWDRFTALVNAPVQGGCADVIKTAMVTLSAALPSGARLVSTVHDELIVECPNALAADVSRIMRDGMVAAMNSLFPEVKADADVAVGSDWGAK